MRIRWKDFELPTSVDYDGETLSDNYGSFSIEPFERGFGTTLGNCFRRILLSSIQGSAVTSIKINGIRCEFENVKGVFEDTSEIVMNLKGLFLKLHTDEPLTLNLSRNEAGEVRASDLSQHQDVEVMNPDLLICTVTDKIDFNLEINVCKGRGFVLARENMRKAKPESTEFFTIDSIFSPVTKVNHRVVETRVGQKTDYEKLEFEIWTNGVISPQEALNEAASIMRKHIMPFISFSSVDKAGKAEKETLVVPAEVPVQESDDKGNLPISVLEPSARTRNCLEAEGIQTLGELVALSEHELMKFRNFGQTSLTEIKEKLVDYGLEIKLG